MSDAWATDWCGGIAKQIAEDLRARLPDERIRCTRRIGEDVINDIGVYRVLVLKRDVAVEVHPDHLAVAYWPYGRRCKHGFVTTGLSRSFELVNAGSIEAAVAEVVWCLAFRRYWREVHRPSHNRGKLSKRAITRGTKLLAWAEAGNRSYDWPC